MRFGIVLPRIFQTGLCRTLVLLLYPGYALCHTEQPPQTQYARDILNRAGRNGVALKMVAGLGHREAFRVVTDGDRRRVEATSPSGLIYGAQAVVSDDVQAGHVQRPDFNIRGTTLWLGGAVQGRRIAPYHSGFNSDTLPWFFDRPFMTRYLDTLASARFNTLFLAVKHPSPEISKYYRYVLGRYFEAFDNVGLYICPGETLATSRQLEWFRDVIFKAAKESGKNPLLIIRDWTLNMNFREQIPALYAEALSAERQVTEAMTPDKVCDLLCELADKAMESARAAQAAATAPAAKAELDRFVSDSQIYVLATRALRHKVGAAIFKARMLRASDADLGSKFLRHMEQSVAVYEDLAQLTDRTYRNANDLMGRHWKSEGLTEFRKDLATQRAWLARFRKQRLVLPPGSVRIEAEEMEGPWRKGSDRYGAFLGQGYAASWYAAKDSEPLPVKSRVPIPAKRRYSVWVRALVGGAHWDARNPTSVIAGLRYVLTGLMSLPEKYTSAEKKKRWQTILDRLPPMPTGNSEKFGGRYLKPAANYNHRGWHCPEMFPLYPYELFGLDLPDLDLMKRTSLATGGDRYRTTAWEQANIHGPRLGETVVDFKLHAPGRTIVEGKVRAGRMTYLEVIPRQRRNDVVLIRLH